MNLIPFTGAVVAFLLALSSWMETIQKDKERNEKNPPKVSSSGILSSKFNLSFLYKYTATFLFFSLTILLLHIYAELTKEIHFESFFYGIHIPCLLLIGPLGYIFFEEMSGGEVYKIRFFHFLPSLLSVLYVFLFRPLGDLISKFGFELQTNLFYVESILVLLGISVVSILGYISFFLVRMFVWKLDSMENIQSSFLPFISFLFFSLFVVVLFVLSQLFFMSLFLLACFALTSLLVLLLVLKMNHKDLILKFKLETRLARYQESRVKGIDVSQVLQRLSDLMNLNQLYLHEDLTLASLAKHLDLNTHQLSEILNAKLGYTFRNYVNGFRLSEAARLLKEKPEMPIISIIYSSGFNSKSSFHKLFMDRYGVSPQVFRSKTN
ncbi:AraC family transcriptional regulator [Leptospira kanakyensis]|uniref:AraC family transcriptional regulator n=1 Tax=Leptospira kanakyensis TaxID=2484968 RepID=UPI00223D4BF4|nr:helix-turn-helix domain-containing protein [Leptospira kanakyensis]MCW7482815.1 helix-turn-helix domain-containing protein [Leptospira kanakyensis]